VRALDAIAFAVLLGCVFVFFATAPKHGAFYWSDAPRHAMNGVFLKDFIAAAPFDRPAEFAYDYYGRYPALTILFYPPLFYVLSAPLYALFGVSHSTALLAVMLHYLAFAWGVYRLACQWVAPLAALGVALALALLPEVAFWGRQVMLEVPSFAWLVWSAFHFVRHLRTGATRSLVFAAGLLVLAMYCKVSVCFVAAAYAAALLHARGLAVLAEKRVWWILLAAAVALVPLVILTLKFGQANVQSVSGVADSVVSRRSLDGWLWYARQFPAQLGWPMLLGMLGLLGFAMLASVVGKSNTRQVAAPLRRAELTLWLAWWGFGYVFFSLIDLKEARHSVYLLLPMVLLPLLVASCMLTARVTVAVAAGMAMLAGTWTFAQRPVLFVDGYAEVANWVGERAPENSAVLFSGYRDGAFIFNVRALPRRPDLSVVRADKLLLNVAVRRELGVQQKAVTEDQLRADLNRLAVHYLVVQPGFWNDLPAMQRFERVLSDRQHFIEVARFKTPANFPAHESELVVYRNLQAADSAQGGQRIDLPIIQRTIQAK
jgi:hypothetical protein